MCMPSVWYTIQPESGVCQHCQSYTLAGHSWREFNTWTQSCGDVNSCQCPTFNLRMSCDVTSGSLTICCASICNWQAVWPHITSGFHITHLMHKAWLQQVLGRDKIFFSSPKHKDWLSDPPSCLFTGYQDSFTRVKWPAYDVDLWTSAEVKNERGFT